MTQGLVIGKFYPPHLGHSHLISYALMNADTVDVLVCDNSHHRIDAKTRKRWIESMHPAAKVKIIPDLGEDKDDDSEAWADHTLDFLGYSPDIVFSSEAYGVTYAQCMQAKHVMVDKERKKVPISGRRIRQDLIKEWDFLSPLVRANYIPRICVLGAESTGTTTLVKALAQHYQTIWVPEYGRYYSEILNDLTHQWLAEELIHIAKTQKELEDIMAGFANKVLICDTNAFATRLWNRWLVGNESSQIDTNSKEDKTDLYIVTGDEIPFVQDGIRSGQNIRHAMHLDFISELKQHSKNFIIASGLPNDRLRNAITAIDKILERKVRI